VVGPFWRAVVCRVIGDSRQGDHAALKLKFDELPTTVESEIVRQVFQYQLLEGGGIHPAGRRNHASGGSHSGTEGAAHEPPVGRGPTPPRPTGGSPSSSVRLSSAGRRRSRAPDLCRGGLRWACRSDRRPAPPASRHRTGK
jgi:hypothetical protein